MLVFGGASHNLNDSAVTGWHSFSYVKWLLITTSVPDGSRYESDLQVDGQDPDCCWDARYCMLDFDRPTCLSVVLLFLFGEFLGAIEHVPADGSSRHTCGCLHGFLESLLQD